MHRVVNKFVMIARRATQVVVILRSQVAQQSKHANLFSTRMGQGFARGLRRCAASEGSNHSTSPRALHPILQSRCRGHEGLFRASLTYWTSTLWQKYP